MLWPDFKALWPSVVAGATAAPAGTVEAFSTIGPWPLPTVNTALLLTSGVTLTIAHHALIANQRSKTVFWMWVTVILGATSSRQLQENLTALEVLPRLDAAVLERIEAIVQTKPTARASY